MKALQVVQDTHHALERVYEQEGCVGMPSRTVSLVGTFFPREGEEGFACGPHRKDLGDAGFDGNTQKGLYSPEVAS